MEIFSAQPTSLQLRHAEPFDVLLQRCQALALKANAALLQAA